MEKAPLDTSRAIADWASASVIADQSARTLGDRLLATVSVSALAVATVPLAFVLTCGVRLLAVAELVRRPAPEAPALDDADLPTYTVLVPIYRERSIVPDPAQRMRAIDYPTDRIEVIVLIEEDDRETGRAVAEHMVGPPFRHMVVPAVSPSIPIVFTSLANLLHNIGNSNLSGAKCVNLWNPNLIEKYY